MWRFSDPPLWVSHNIWMAICYILHFCHFSISNQCFFYLDHRFGQGQVRRQVDQVQGRDRQEVQEPIARQPQIPSGSVDVPLGEVEAPSMPMSEDSTERVLPHPRRGRRRRRRGQQQRGWGRGRGQRWRRRCRHVRLVRHLRLRGKERKETVGCPDNDAGPASNGSDDQEENSGHGMEEGMETKDEEVQAKIEKVLSEIS